MSENEGIENLTDDDINDLLDDDEETEEEQEESPGELNEEELESVASEEEADEVSEEVADEKSATRDSAQQASPESEEQSTATGATSRIEEYDFLEPSRFNRSELEKLKRISTNVAQRAAHPLSRLLKTKVEMQLTSCDQTMWQYIAEDFSEGRIGFPFKLPPLGYYGLLVIDMSFCCSCLESLTGGDFEATESENITDTDAKVFSNVARRIVEALPELWKDLGDFDIEMDEFIPDIESAAPFPPSEDMFMMSLLAEGEFGTEQMAICVPFEMVRDLPQMMAEDDESDKGPDEDVQQKVLDTIRDVPVELSVDLGQALIPGRQILELEPGDALVLDSPINEPLQVRINQRPKLIARPVKSNKNLAIKIEGEL